MKRQLILRPEAEADIDDVYSWYELRREGLGREFVMELDNTLASIRYKPKSHRKVHKELRRALLKRFPYAVFYFLRGDEIIVTAVFHQTMDPNRWKQLS